MRCLITVTSLLLLVCSAGTVARADLIYEFSGVLPNGASLHPMVADGESYTVTFRIDDSVTDSSVDPTLGIYLGNVLSGAIEFSGGFSQNLSTQADGYRVVVYDNFEFGGVFLDGVSVRIDPATTDTVLMSVAETSTAGSLFDDDSLPGAGTSFASSSSSGGPTSNWFQMKFTDEITGERVRYFAFSSFDTVFSASVPEPSCFMLLGVFGLVGFARRRKTPVLDF